MDEKQPLGPSQSWRHENGMRWDVIVIGAGPAGAMAAIVSARQGLSTLLVDRSSFPRDKVCGGCLNGAALTELSAVGLGDLAKRLGGSRLEHFRLAATGAEANLELPIGVCVSRMEFDMALIQEAIASGVEFLPLSFATDAGLAPNGRRVHLHGAKKSALAEASWVIAADGLSGGYSKSLTEIGVHQPGDSYIGLANVSLLGAEYEAGIIHMATSSIGYAGLVNQKGSHLHIAAAISTRQLKKYHSPGAAIAQILESNHWPVPHGLTSSRFKGTPRLRTRRYPVTAARVFLVGDAAGYIEPFTGEGIAWALGGGRAAALRLPAAISHFQNKKENLNWDLAYRELIVSRQRWCRLSTHLLRHPTWTRIGVRLLALAPKLASPMIAAINRPWEEH